MKSQEGFPPGFSYIEDGMEKEELDKIISKYSTESGRLLGILEDIQRNEGYLPKDALTYISKALNTPLSKLYSLTTFYSLFNLKPAGKHVIRICRNLSCHLAGAEKVVEGLKESLGIGLRETTPDGEFTLEETSCLGLCSLAPAMMIDDKPFGNLTPEKIPEILKEIRESDDSTINKEPDKGSERNNTRMGKSPTEKVKGVPFKAILRNVGLINPESIEDYTKQGGYTAFKKALSLKPEDVIEEVKKSELIGRGGAGFPTGLKWELTAHANGNEKYIVCNADEGEPGTFKDRTIMENDPHTLLEGMINAGYATGAKKGYIYIRGEYTLSIERVEKAINNARNHKLLGDRILGTDFSFDIEIKKGAGSYVCGEETALLESMEGKRAEPRNKPPYPPTFGLWGQPTVINNVETLANIPLIITKGTDWYKSIGVPGSYGTKLFSLIGDVNWKGVIEAPFGTPLSKIVMGIGGGIKDGKKLKAVVLGGVSGSLITPDEIDIPIDLNSLARIEAGPGSGSIVVLDEKRCIVDITKNIAHFFRRESCGKCAPCRMGIEEVYKIIDRISKGYGEEKDLDTIVRLGKTMKVTSFCGLGQTAPNIVLQSIDKFRDEWLVHIKEKKCPANVCEMNITGSSKNENC